MTPSSIYISLTYAELERPFELTRRVGHPAETTRHLLCRLSMEDAKLLGESGVQWRHGRTAPDWNEVRCKITLMKLEAARADKEW